MSAGGLENFEKLIFKKFGKGKLGESVTAQ